MSMSPMTIFILASTVCELRCAHETDSALVDAASWEPHPDPKRTKQTSPPATPTTRHIHRPHPLFAIALGEPRQHILSLIPLYSMHRIAILTSFQHVEWTRGTLNIVNPTFCTRMSPSSNTHLLSSLLATFRNTYSSLRVSRRLTHRASVQSTCFHACGPEVSFLVLPSVCSASALHQRLLVQRREVSRWNPPILHNNCEMCRAQVGPAERHHPTTDIHATRDCHTRYVLAIPVMDVV